MRLEFQAEATFECSVIQINKIVGFSSISDDAPLFFLDDDVFKDSADGAIICSKARVSTHANANDVVYLTELHLSVIVIEEQSPCFFG
eukprot:15341661-Ditylum_brightwellii.AAC.1